MAGLFSRIANFRRRFFTSGLKRKPETQWKLVWKLSDPLLRLSRGRDFVRHVDLFRGGIIILSSQGGGKSSGSYAAALSACAESGHSLLVLTPHLHAVEAAEKIIRQSGREKHLRILTARNFRYKFLDDAIAHHTEKETLVDECVEILMAGLQPLLRNLGRFSAEHPFFRTAGKRFTKACILVDRTANGSISLIRVLRMMQSVPTSVAALEEEHRSFLLQQIEKAKANCAPEQAVDLQICIDHLSLELATLSNETRSSITVTGTNDLSPMTEYPLRNLFSGEESEESTFLPDELVNGNAIVICAVTPAEYPVAGRVAPCILKRGVQAGVLRRMNKAGGVRDSTTPVGIFADEAALWAHEFDQTYLERTRASRGYMVYTGQSVSTFANALGGGEAGMFAAQDLLNCFQVRIGHSLLCQRSQLWFADTLGKIKVQKATTGVSMNPSPNGKQPNRTETHNWTEVEEYELPPRAFVGLETGGEFSKPANVVEGIVIICGRKFSNGRRYLLTRFRQGYLGARLDVLWRMRKPEVRNWVNSVSLWDIVKAFVGGAESGKAMLYRFANFWTEGRAFKGKPGGNEDDHA